MPTDRSERQQRLLQTLTESIEPLTGSALADLCNVTRQVVVHDIALLRAAGIPIVATPRGYWVSKTMTSSSRSVLAVRHPAHLTEQELYILVDHGITVEDVFVEHPVYGELRGTLHLSSRRDVDLFMKSVHETQAQLLSSLTEGTHFHSVEYQEIAQLEEAVAALRQAGIWVSENL